MAIKNTSSFAKRSQEFVEMIDIGLEDIEEFNHRLLDWLIEYNSIRPHQTLDYLTPLEYLDQNQQKEVLPMSSSQTSTCYYYSKLLNFTHERIKSP